LSPASTSLLPEAPQTVTVSTDKLDIAIVGLGFGRTIVDEVRAEPAASLFNLSAVCDLDESRLREHSQRSGVTGYRSLDELLEKDNSPVIGLFSAPHGRANLVRKIIRAGRDVLTTKPFEVDPMEAASVLDEARSLGRIIHMNSPGPAPSQDLRLVDEWRVRHDLGRPVGGAARVWVSYNEKADGSWTDDPKRCPAAPLFRLGIYLFNDMRHIFGPAESLQLMTSSLRTGRPTPDNAQVNIKYRNGALGHVFASFCVLDGDHYRNSMVLNFERGTIYRNAGGLRKGPDSGKGEIVLVREGRHNVRRIVELTELTEMSGLYQWAVLAEAVRQRRIPGEASTADIVEGIRLVKAMSKAELSPSAVAV
jgi:predicted dehydrogenase